MAKLTLLEMTQNILSAMDSDEVNSINDTVESMQVAEIIKETYYDLFASTLLPSRTGIIKLQGLGDLDRPNYLKFTDNAVEIFWIKYKNSQTDNYQDVYYLSEIEFFERVLQNKSTSDNVLLVTDASGITYYVKTNQTPSYYTVINNEYLIMDSYDNAYDSTLQASKTFALGTIEEPWANDDDFIPNLDSTLFPLLLAEAKSVCFINLKQQASQKEEQRARKHRVNFQWKKWRDSRQRADEFKGPTYARLR